MLSEINNKLAQLRKRMVVESEEAFGPDSDAMSAAASAAEDADVEMGGEGGAENVSPLDALVDDYIGEIVASILDEYEMSEEEALDLVMTVADDLAADNTLPPLPDYGDEAGSATWLGASKAYLFGDFVMQAVESLASEE
jgi:hypothetical protein